MCPVGLHKDRCSRSRNVLMTIAQPENMRTSVPSIDDIGGEESTLAFNSLLLLIFVIFIAPQALIPALEPLHLAKLAAILAIVAYSASILPKGTGLTIMGTEVKLVLGLVALVLVSMTYSRWPGGSVEFFLDQYSKTVMVFFLVANLLNTTRLIDRFIWLIVLCSGFNALIGIYNYRTGVFLSEALNRIMGGYSGITGNPNDLALSLNLALPFVWYFMSAQQKSRKVLAGIILITSVASIILSFSRGGLLTLIALLIWAGYSKWRERGVLTMLLYGTAVLAGIMALAVLGPEGYGDRVVSIIDPSKDVSGSRQARWTMMEGSIQTMIHNPLGIGFHMNNLGLQESGLGWAGVHNVYLEIGTELGFVGLIVFLVLQWKLLVAMHTIKTAGIYPERFASLASAIESSMVAFAVAAMFHPVAYHFYFYIAAGLGIAVKVLANKYSVLLEESSGVKDSSLTQVPVVSYATPWATR